jgi:hypothetical protein
MRTQSNGATFETTGTAVGEADRTVCWPQLVERNAWKVHRVIPREDGRANLF